MDITASNGVNQEDNSGNTTMILKLMELIEEWAVYSVLIASETLFFFFLPCFMRLICFFLHYLGFLSSWVLFQFIQMIQITSRRLVGWRKSSGIIFLVISISLWWYSNIYFVPVTRVALWPSFPKCKFSLHSSSHPPFPFKPMNNKSFTLLLVTGYINFLC